MRLEIGSLQEYLTATNENAVDHNNEPPQLMHLVQEMDALFHQELFSDEFDLDPFASLLAANAYALLLSATRQALSGHVAGIFPLVRSALESACYAYLIAGNESLADTWLRRHDSQQAFKASRKIFDKSVAETTKKLKLISPEMAEYVTAQYQAAIDFGAHPNPRSVIDHIEMKGEDDKYFKVELAGVYGRNSWQVNWGLLACVDVGLAIAFLIAASMKDQPLLRERVDVFNALMARKLQIADELNKAPVDYPDAMYTAFKPA